MNDFYNFLNHQSGSRLFFYGIILLFAINIIVTGIYKILKVIFSTFKRDKIK
jgi:hypothetical protein